MPDTFYIAALKVEGDLSFAKFISNTSYYHRKEETGYDGTLYNLGFYQEQPTTLGASPVIPYGDIVGNGVGYPFLDGTGLHLPAGATNYRSPASIDNGQQNITEELRLQSNDSSSQLSWTTGIFFAADRQTYLEQIHDPLLNELTMAATGNPYTTYFTAAPDYVNPVLETTSGPFAYDSYYLQTRSVDKQYAVFADGTYSFTDQYKLNIGLRESHTEFSFNTLTGGPQLFLEPQTQAASVKENSFTPKLNLSYQYDPHNLYYFTYAKGFRPGGGNNPVPYAACSGDFQTFNIKAAPLTFSSDSVDSFEVGAKNNIDNRFKFASSIYYIKWNNIQQTVVPPVCQISFIDNLGKAVAKGADLQAEIALTDHFTAEFATGYTDARYTQDSKLSPAEQHPIVASGDAITGQSGQPNAPFTASLGLEYKFTMFSRESFIRVDDEYESRSKWPSPQQDLNTLQGDSANFVLASTNFASLRSGMDFGSFQLAAFIDNLTDTHPVTNYEFSIDPGQLSPAGTPYSRLQRDFTYRPRTFGLTFTYRH